MLPRGHFGTEDGITFSWNCEHNAGGEGGMKYLGETARNKPGRSGSELSYAM